MKAQTKRLANQPKDVHRSSRILRTLLDATHEAMVVLDEEGDIVFANAAAHRIWGYADSGLEGLPLNRLFAPKFEFLQLQHGGLRHGVTTESEGCRADGSLFPVEVNIREMEVDGYFYRLVTADDEVANREMDAARQQVATFESLERFASGLAHELNNVLTGVLGNIHLAMEESGRRGRLQPALLEAAHNASLRARELTKELLEFAKGEPPEACATSLRQLVRENCLIALSGSRMKCEFDFAGDLTAAYLDPAQFGQVIHQLVTFAADATGHSGMLKFHAENRLVESDEDAFGGELMYGNYVVLSIRLPLQMADREMEHLFEPYARFGQGCSGLSLAISRSIVKRHSGHMTVEDDEDGLAVALYLPASVDVAQDTVTPLSSGVPSSQGAKVLVVDDQQLVRLVLQRSLEGAGHRVTACENGEEAIEIYADAERGGDRFDVVFLDVTIPGGMGGGETCRRILEIDPLAACVVISGNTADEIMTNYQAYGFVDHLSKPFDVDILERLVESLVEDRDAVSEQVAEEEEDEDPVALPFSDNIVEIDFSSPDR